MLHSAELEIADEFSNLIVINKDSNIVDVEKQLKNIFINIDKFDIEKFNKNYSARAVSNKLNINQDSWPIFVIN